MEITLDSLQYESIIGYLKNPESYTLSGLDCIYKISMIIIAFFNVVFAVYIYNYKSSKEDAEKEKDRKIAWFKALVLDHNLTPLYKGFDDIHEISIELLSNPDDNKKNEINKKIALSHMAIRHNFTDMLLGIDINLYNKILLECDKLQDYLSEKIFDEGINLYHEPKFNEEIRNRIIETKTHIIGILFAYRGD